MKNVIKQIDSGYYDPLNNGLSEWTNISTNDTPHYIVNRSTSQLENLHQLLHSLLSCATSSIMAHFLVTAYIYRFNRLKGNRLDHLQNEARCHQCFDPRLLKLLCETIIKIKNTLSPDLVSYWMQHNLTPISKEELSSTLYLQSGVYRNKSSMSLASKAVEMNRFSDKQIDSMLEYNISNHISSSIIQKDYSVLLSKLPMATSYVTTASEKIFIDHFLRDSNFSVSSRQDLDYSKIVKASDFLALFNWHDISLAYNDAILSAYDFKENGDELEIKTKPIVCKKRCKRPGNSNEYEIIDCELDPMQLL
jgi:hypothetical protein